MKKDTVQKNEYSYKEVQKMNRAQRRAIAKVNKRPMPLGTNKDHLTKKRG